jgi:hypothetical protein
MSVKTKNQAKILCSCFTKGKRMLQFYAHIFQNGKVCYNFVSIFFKAEKYVQYFLGLVAINEALLVVFLPPHREKAGFYPINPL